MNAMARRVSFLLLGALTALSLNAGVFRTADASKIVGRVACAIPGAITLVLEGPGLARTERTLSASGAFEFATPGFRDGTATLPMTRRDGEGRVWDAELTLKNFKPVKGPVYAKVVTLGGGYDLPIFAANDFSML